MQQGSADIDGEYASLSCSALLVVVKLKDVSLKLTVKKA
jgi:hypothetical protein